MIDWGQYRTALDPAFAQAVDEALKPLDSTWVVTFGFRSRDEQAALYAKHLAGGPLAAKPGHSPHEFGLAVDVALRKFDGTLTWDVSYPAWGLLWKAIYASPDLHSGHSFPADTGGKVEEDDDHIEAFGWAHFDHMIGQPSKIAQLEAAGQW